MPENRSHPGSSATFAPTRWTLVLAAAQANRLGWNSPQAHEALTELCQIYWYPLYAFVRRSGYSAPNAEDMTQEFFTRLLSKDCLARVDRTKGRFRSFLLASMKHFLANQRDRAQARKRGGGKRIIPLDAIDAESRYDLASANQLTPEKIYDRQWAMTLLGEVLETLRQEMFSAGKACHFNELRNFLTRSEKICLYAQAAANLHMTEGAVKVTVYRLRRRYRELLREHIAQTVANLDEVDDEIRHLFSACRE